MRPRRGHRHLKTLRELEQQFRCTRETHARPAEEYRTLRGQQPCGDILHLRIESLRRNGRRIFHRIVRVHRFRIDHRSLHIHGDVQPARSRAAMFRQKNCALEMIADRLGLGDRLRILRDARDHADDVRLLIAELPQLADQSVRQEQRLALHLPGNHQHRNRVRPCAEHAIQRVDPAGTAGHVEHPDLIADARIAFRGDGARLLMVAANVVEPRTAPDGVIQVHGTAAGDHEDMADSVIGQGFGNIVSES